MAEPIDGSSDEARTARLERLGAEMKRAREAVGITQAQLGERLAVFLGEPVPQTTVSRWENGTVSTDFETARAIELALGLTPGTLGRRAGYVVATDVERWTGFTAGFLSDVDDAVEHMKAADLLTLGVRVWNRMVPAPEYGEGYETVEWVVELFTDIPTADDR